VDTHIFRVANRTGLAPGDNVRTVEDHLVKVVPEEYAHDAHHWLILHGRYTCIARKPKCPTCVILDLCEYKQKTKPEVAPVKRSIFAKKPRLAATLRRKKMARA
jgi:endonuclease-3